MSPRDAGHALGTLLVLLLAFALLALSATAAAIAGLAAAGQEAERLLAGEAADAAVARVLAGWPASRNGQPPQPAWPDLPAEITTDAVVAADDPTLPPPWRAGMSLPDDGAGIAIRHYTVVATGRARRGATVRVEQGFTLLEAAP